MIQSWTLLFLSWRVDIMILIFLPHKEAQIWFLHNIKIHSFSIKFSSWMAAFRFGRKVRSEVRCWLAFPYIILTPASKRAAEQKLATNCSLFGRVRVYSGRMLCKAFCLSEADRGLSGGWTEGVWGDFTDGVGGWWHRVIKIVTSDLCFEGCAPIILARHWAVHFWKLFT